MKSLKYFHKIFKQSTLTLPRFSNYQTMLTPTTLTRNNLIWIINSIRIVCKRNRQRVRH